MPLSLLASRRGASSGEGQSFRGDTLGFTALEAFDTGEMRRRRWIFAQVGMFIVLWCAAALATGEHLRSRDNVFMAVYYGGLIGLVVLALRRARHRRRRAVERRALAERLSTQQ